MPRLELIDAMGTPYRIDTFDWDKIRAWLEEWLPKLAVSRYPPTLSVYPLMEWTREKLGVPDWDLDTRFFRPFPIPFDVDEAMAAIEAERKHIKEQKHRADR